MTIINTIDNYFPWFLLVFTAIAEAVLVLWFTTS
jgi:hypothetical protein